MKISVALILFVGLLLVRIYRPFAVYDECDGGLKDCGYVDMNWVVIIGGAMVLAGIVMKIIGKRSSKE